MAWVWTAPSEIQQIKKMWHLLFHYRVPGTLKTPGIFHHYFLLNLHLRILRELATVLGASSRNLADVVWTPLHERLALSRELICSAMDSGTSSSPSPPRRRFSSVPA